MDVQLSALTPPERLAATRAYMLGWRIPMDLRPHQPLNVTAKSRSTDLGSSCLLSTTGSGASVVRNQRLARDHTTPQLVISVLGGGTSIVNQHQRTAHLRPDDLVCYSSTEPYRITFPHGTTRHSLMIPLDQLGLPTRIVTTLSARPIVAGNPLGRLVSAYLLQLAAVAPRLRAHERDAVEEPAISLIRALLASTADHDSAADALGASLEMRLVEYLNQNFANREIAIPQLAAIHGISERHVYTVLRGAGISLRPWLREQRLVAAADALNRPTNCQHTISGIAHRWGFADHAHFAREFRKRFGVTPTQWRNQPPGSPPTTSRP